MRPVTATALAEYKRVTALTLAGYQRMTAVAHLALCVPDCPFDGRSIFS